MPSYEVIKPYLYTYRLKNKELYNEYQRKLVYQIREFKNYNNYELIAKTFRKISI